MIDYHVVVGALAVALTLVGYGSYFRSIFLGETKPHAFTWIVFTFIDGIIFFIQLGEGGGPGAWVLGVAALFSAVVSILSLRFGEKDIRPIDWACLLGAVVGLCIWQGIDNAFGAVILLSMTNMLATAPTFRKSFIKPGEESVIIWALDVVKFSLSIVALESRTLTTALFPASIAVVNSMLVIMVLLRRRTLAAKAKTR